MALTGLLLNIVIAALLAATIFYCWSLNRRIKILQDSKSELAQLLKHFDESTQRASESIIALQTASKKIGENIQLRIDKANYMLDDLAFMIEKGQKLSSQIEASFAVNRARTRVMSEPPEEKNSPAMESEPSRQAEKTVREKTAASLEAVLERVVGRKPQMSGNEDKRGPDRPRSKAEQELLDMLKVGMKG